jgi:glucan phosphoethanolaminetransferase (alkaline phosphatase superfamily)
MENAAMYVTHSRGVEYLKMYQDTPGPVAFAIVLILGWFACVFFYEATFVHRCGILHSKRRIEIFFVGPVAALLIALGLYLGGWWNVTIAIAAIVVLGSIADVYIAHRRWKRKRS